MIDYRKYLMKWASEDSSDLITNGKNLKWVMNLLEVLFLNTRYVVRIYIDKFNSDLWKNEDLKIMLNSIINKNNLTLKILTTNISLIEDFFDKSLEYCIIKEVSPKGLEYINEVQGKCEHNIFLFDDKMFRFEYDVDNMCSYAKFNDEETVKILKERFENTWKLC